MRAARHFGLFLLYGTLGAALALLAVYVVYLSRLPQPHVWQRVQLDAEFRAADAATVRTLDDYRGVEERVFAQLRERIYDRIPADDRRALNRYSPGSLADATAQSPNWNRTIELAVPEPRGGVVLLHGLTDSPYSLRAVAERLHAMGYWVVGLRLPGHGTAPSGLLDFDWRDFAAAARIATRHVRAKIGPDRPLYLVGYSTGAALAVEYELARLQGEDVPKTAGLVLISPAIGISPAAALAVWQGRLATIPGLENAAWTAIVPEYDPYKYTSFTVNAAVQVHAITQVVARRLDALAAAGGVKGLPPILAFQSVADNTVSTAAVVDALFRRLAPEGHELVLFDINRHAEADPLLRADATATRDEIMKGPPLPFGLTIIANENPHSAAVVALRRPALSTETRREPTDLRWPADVFSLSHVALPIAPDDPVYGAARPATPGLIYLGRPELLGERGLLALPVGDLIRLRHNPFFPYVDARLRAFLGSEPR